tara:strand:+ start:5498 stop:6625 length:1128 start_codon:yes stop_codon:yes gene_type:complete
MMRALSNIFRLGIKELYSLLRDPVLMVLIFYAFTAAIYVVAKGVKTELSNAAIAVVDEDRSALSARISGALQQPYFKPPTVITLDQVDALMDAGRYSFILDIPPRFEADLLAGRSPVIQLNVDATAMSIAGNGALYIQSIVTAETADFVNRSGVLPRGLVNLSIRAKFNPNLESTWFLAAMQIINNVSILAIILSGAAVIRERERGTIEHLLAMPVSVVEIMLAKIWANGLVIVVATVLSLRLIVGGALGVPIAGSVTLFAFGVVVYLFAVTSIGVMLSTLARSMPQFGLAAIPVFIVMILLSGAVTPIESMPPVVQMAVQVLPSTHFIKFSQAVLYRGAEISIVWPHLTITAVIGAVCFAIAFARFRAALAAIT